MSRQALLPLLMVAPLWSCSGDKDVTFTPYNTEPGVTIQAPRDGITVDQGEAVAFEAKVSDAQDEASALLLTWRSDRDGDLDDSPADASGYASYTTANLSPGAHVITLEVIDSGGKSATDFISLTIDEVAQTEDDPTIQIESPSTADSDVGVEGRPYTFEAIVSDNQDAPADLYVWFESDVDDVFCEPTADSDGLASCDFALSLGEHVLSFGVVDLDGNETIERIAFEVRPPGEVDVDSDDYSPAEGDCDDNDPAVHPGAEEVYDGLDNDCDAQIDEGTVGGDDDGDGMTELEGDCDDTDATVYDGAPEVCDGVDDDCDDVIDDGTLCVDDDGDGLHEGSGDCDDTDATVYTGAVEIADGQDNDCDTYVDEGTDLFDDDGDCACEDAGGGLCSGSVEPSCSCLVEGDCDDTDEDVSPDADELCDSVDNDCDGTTDEGSAVDADTWYRDGDRDSYGDPSRTTTACALPTGYVANDDDCDDTIGTVYPGATETCNSDDDDCDGTTDEGVTSTFYRDADSDTYGSATVTTSACTAPSGYVSNDDDCDDSSSADYPGAPEYCNSDDDDCDGTVDESSAVDASTWYYDADSDTYGGSTSTVACTRPTGYVASSSDCNDGLSSVYPGATEYCNSRDDNCDGTTDESTAADASTWYRDADSDGYGVSSTTTRACTVPSGYSALSTDCNDGSATVSPGATETCDSVDNDCDTTIDEGVTTVYYRDADGDGYGNAALSTSACSAPSGYVSNDDDCDDTNAALSPITVWYLDADSDGQGGSTTTLSCTQPSGYVSNNTDCNDLSSAAYVGATESCDTIDNDCDGETDERNAVGCTNYYPDVDGDAYGDEDSFYRCYCEPTDTYTETDNDDCYDANYSANPAQTAYFSAQRGDGSFDYNCNDAENKRYSALYACSLTSCTTGWLDGSAPACGESETYVSSCTATACYATRTEVTRTQTCR